MLGNGCFLQTAASTKVTSLRGRWGTWSRDLPDKTNVKTVAVGTAGECVVGLQRRSSRCRRREDRQGLQGYEATRLRGSAKAGKDSIGMPNDIDIASV